MRRREFLALAAATATMPRCSAPQRAGSVKRGPSYASPAAAMKGPRETLLYTTALYVGTGVDAPDCAGVGSTRDTAPGLAQGALNRSPSATKMSAEVSSAMTTMLNPTAAACLIRM